MADMGRTRVESARLLVLSCRAHEGCRSGRFSKEASMAKALRSETAMFCAHAAVQIFVLTRSTLR